MPRSSFNTAPPATGGWLTSASSAERQAAKKQALDTTQTPKRDLSTSPVAPPSKSDPPYPLEQHANIHLIVTSEGLGWKGFCVSRQKEEPHKRTHSPRPHLLIGLTVSGSGLAIERLNGVSVHTSVLPNRFIIIPPYSDFDININNTIETIYLCIHQNIVDEITKGLSGDGVGSVGISPSISFFSPLLEQLVSEVCHLARMKRSSSASYAGHLIRAIAAHVVENHSAVSTSAQDQKAIKGLSPRNLNLVIEFIDKNLSKSLSLEDIASVCDLSSSHFTRLFRSSTSLTPHQYLLRRRIDTAQRLLIESGMSISEIAFECGFADQVHFTQTFRRFTGKAPGAFRKAHWP
ncbi:helix-turn-helix domain-containing protein [Labrys miyagiensis]|uniref:helix-turn-helix domain-containing protein n=1 Tax=Labrys miyagiensis TaxID=346912 RepID=UPI0024E0F0B5|nr:AraC family transcriptional regulator [Labrys miyagiensis]